MGSMTSEVNRIAQWMDWVSYLECMKDMPLINLQRYDKSTGLFHQVRQYRHRFQDLECLKDALAINLLRFVKITGCFHRNII